MKKSFLCVLLLFSFSLSFSQSAWLTKAPFLGGKRAGSAVFGINNLGYLFGGIDFFGVSSNDLWQYNPTADQWTQLSSMPGPARFSPAFCVSSNIAYIGTGSNSSVYFNDWWAYNPSSNSWTQKTDVPGPTRNTAFGLSILDKCYVGMGISGTWLDDWYEYDIATDTWTQKNNFPYGARQNGVAFDFGNFGYVGLGATSNFFAYDDFYKYDPSLDSWTPLASYPSATGIYAPGYFKMGNLAYVCGGYDYFSLHDDCYTYDPSSNTWSPIVSFSNVSPPRYFRGGFSNYGNGYLVGGSTDASLGTTGYREDLIELTTAKVGIDDVPAIELQANYKNETGELVISSKENIRESIVYVHSISGMLVGKFEITNQSEETFSLNLTTGIYLFSVENKFRKINGGKFIVL